jgi:hypothetical protein
MKYSKSISGILRQLKPMLIVTLVVAAGPSLEASPRMVIAEPSLDAGIVAPGQMPEMVFTIENQGDEPLTITARPTCGCTVAEWDKTIAPGASGQVRAVIDTGKITGKLSKTIMILANDPETPTIRLVANAEIRPLIEVLPKPMVYLESRVGETVSASVVLAPTDAGEAGLEVLAIEAGAEYVTATARRLEADENEAHGRYEITLAVNEKAPAGLINVPVTVRTNLSGAPNVDIRVIGKVLS